MYLLDTCFLSELKKKHPAPSVVEAFHRLVPNQIFISVVTVGEIAAGIDYLSPSAHKEELLSWLHGIEDRFNRTILPINLPVMWRWAKLNADLRQQGFVLPGFDGLLAATALEHQLTVITRNVSDFANTNVDVYNPWSVAS